MAEDKNNPIPPLPPARGGATPPPLPPMRAAAGGGGMPPMPPLFEAILNPPPPAMPPALPGLQAPRLPQPPQSLQKPMPPPALPPLGGARPAPPPMSAGPLTPAPQNHRQPEAQAPRDPDAEKEKYEKKLGELEKRLQEEREKVLLASLKSQEESAAAARVEVSIKELQDKLRRERRDQDHEESRLKLENKVAELETRLATERETWVTTLKNQMQQREGQEKEVETHFTLRIQEMERRWLEEKAHWQKTVLAKDEENRNLRTLAEKLRGIDAEQAKLIVEKKALETRVSELMQERSEAQGKLSNALEKEKENIQLRAELSLARQQSAMVQQQQGSLQEKYERELQSQRISSKEREERLMTDVDRLQRDLMSATARLRAEYEAEMQRYKNSTEGASSQEIQRYKESADKANDELTRLRAICGALEKQAAANRVQLDGLQKASAQWEKTQERYKAEFMVLQRKWVEREQEIRSDIEAQNQQLLEAEKIKAKLAIHEEFKRRETSLTEAARAEKERMRLEYESGLAGLRAELEREHDREAASRRKEFENLKAKFEEASAALMREEQSRQLISRERLELEKAVQAGKEEVGALKAALAASEQKNMAGQQRTEALARDMAQTERLAMGQAAEMRNIQDGLVLLRNQLAQESGRTQFYLQEKNRLERELLLQKKEIDLLARSGKPAA